MKLTKQQLKRIRQRLMTEREKFAGEIRSIAQGASHSPREASGDLSAYTVHLADMAADTCERELSTNLISTEQQVLYEIDDAFKRLDDGTFGVCVECSTPITMSRLKAVPYAASCIACQRAKEQDRQ